MDLNTSRLNLPLMVNNSLHPARSSSSFHACPKGEGITTNVGDSLNSIYRSIHNSLKSGNMKRSILKQAANQIHEKIEEPASRADAKVPNNSNSKNNIRGKNTNSSKTNMKNKNHTKRSANFKKYNSKIFNKYKFNIDTNKTNNTTYQRNFTSKPNSVNPRNVAAKRPIAIQKSYVTMWKPTIPKTRSNNCPNSPTHAIPVSKNIAQATINCEQKHRQIIANRSKQYDVYQHEAMVLRQKKILEGMLQEHKILETNRRNIKQEIQSMKSYINEIRDKLDKALVKLSDKKTICGPLPRSKSATPSTAVRRVQTPKKNNPNNTNNNVNRKVRVNNQPNTVKK